MTTGHPRDLQQKDELVVGSIPSHPPLTHPSASLLLAIGSNSDCGENVRAFLCTYTVITQSANRPPKSPETLKPKKDNFDIGRSNLLKR